MLINPWQIRQMSYQDMSAHCLIPEQVLRYSSLSAFKTGQGIPLRESLLLLILGGVDLLYFYAQSFLSFFVSIKFYRFIKVSAVWYWLFSILV